MWATIHKTSVKARHGQYLRGPARTAVWYVLVHGPDGRLVEPATTYKTLQAALNAAHRRGLEVVG
jgi:hypothetical protein